MRADLLGKFSGTVVAAAQVIQLSVPVVRRWGGQVGNRRGSTASRLYYALYAIGSWSGFRGV
jgi:hypothetical protein